MLIKNNIFKCLKNITKNFSEIVRVILRIKKIHSMIKIPVIFTFRYKICYLLFFFIVFIPILLTLFVPMIPKKNNDSWIYGPNFFPRDRLLEWLKNNAYDENGTRRLFRLPVVIEFEDSFQLKIKRCYIGNKNVKKNEDVILLRIDDTGMGLDFISLVQRVCPKKRNICVVWIEGLWGTLIEDESNIQKKEDNYPFTVLKVIGEVKEKNPLPMVKKKKIKKK